MRILWVENHAVFARLAGRQFLSAHEVIIVPSCAEARLLLAEHAFEVVLLDYDLDDGKGDTLVAFIRESSPSSVVIATSAHRDGNEALLRAGADATCPKGQFATIETVIGVARSSPTK